MSDYSFCFFGDKSIKYQRKDTNDFQVSFKKLLKFDYPNLFFLFFKDKYNSNILF